MAESHDQNEIRFASMKLLADQQNSCLIRMLEAANHSHILMWLSLYQGEITPAMLDIFERDIVDMMDAACKKRDPERVHALFTTAAGLDLARLVNSYYENEKRWENVILCR